MFFIEGLSVAKFENLEIESVGADIIRSPTFSLWVCRTTNDPRGSRHLRRAGFEPPKEAVPTKNPKVCLQEQRNL